MDNGLCTHTLNRASCGHSFRVHLSEEPVLHDPDAYRVSIIQES